MAFIPDKPGHGRFAFRNLNSTQYKTYAQQYSKAKAGGIRCIYCWMSGAGLQVTPPATENPNHRAHSIETAPALPKQ